MKVPLFVELCCGSAAVTLRLIGGPNAKPPISYMGSKRGYAEAILNVLGLRSGQGADACVLVEAGPWARAWRLLTTLEGCRAVAEVIRGWVGEDARELWERLRAEGAAEVEGAEGVGAWCYLAQRTYTGTNVFKPEDVTVSPSGFTRVPLTRPALASRLAALSALRFPPTQIIEGDVGAVEPREVARWLYVQGRKGSAGNGGFVGEYYDNGHTGWPGLAPPRSELASRCSALSAVAWPPTAIAQTDVGAVEPGELPEGTVVFVDPPYSDVTAVVPPMLAAERLPLGRVGRAEGDAALCAVGLDCLREAVHECARVPLREVLRAAGVQDKVLDAVVERVAIDMVDDLVWSQWTADVGLHHLAVLGNVSPVVTHDSVATILPPLALSCATGSGKSLPFWRHLRDFALRCQALPGAATKFSQALAWADCALAAGLGVPGSIKEFSADLAGDLERHCNLRVRVRHHTNTKLARKQGKTTGYAHDLPREKVLEVAQRWSDAGATVCVSEAEPLPLEGWHHVEITGCRVGQKRTFGATPEWLTLNRPPVWRPYVQQRLF